MGRLAKHPPAPVRRRLVLFFPGFESMPAEAHARRFLRELRKTAPVYGFAVPDHVAMDAPDAGAPSSRRFEVPAKGDGWSTATDVVVYGLEDLSAAYLKRNPLVRLGSGIAALADFVLTGTFFRFVAVSWRYALFFLYPLAILAGILLLAGLAFALAADRLGGVPALAGAVAAVALLLLLAARRMHLLLMMDDWSFARDIARGRQPAIRAQLDAIARDAASRIAAAEADEVVLAAHSFGAIAAVSVLAALTGPDSRRSGKLGLLTVGSSLLKIALHPAAGGLRRDVETVVRSGCAWLDVQSLTDPINFYKSDPARELAISGVAPVRTMQVRFRHQLSPETYRSIRRNFFRVHRQFVHGVERRSSYSFHAILCGPAPFAEVVRRPGLAESWGGLVGHEVGS